MPWHPHPHRPPPAPSPPAAQSVPPPPKAVPCAPEGEPFLTFSVNSGFAVWAGNSDVGCAKSRRVAVSAAGGRAEGGRWRRRGEWDLVWAFGCRDSGLVLSSSSSLLLSSLELSDTKVYQPSIRALLGFGSSCNSCKGSSYPEVSHTKGGVRTGTQGALRVSRFMVYGFGFWVYGFGFMVLGLGLKV